MVICGYKTAFEERWKKKKRASTLTRVEGEEEQEEEFEEVEEEEFEEEEFEEEVEKGKEED